MLDLKKKSESYHISKEFPKAWFSDPSEYKEILR